MLHLEHLVNDHQVLLPTCGILTQLNTQLSTCTTMCSHQIACTCVLPHYTHHAPHQHTPQRLSAKYQFPNIQPIHVSANPNNNLILKLRTSAYQKPIFLYAGYTFLMFSCEQQVNNFISSKKNCTDCPSVHPSRALSCSPSIQLYHYSTRSCCPYVHIDPFVNHLQVLLSTCTTLSRCQILCTCGLLRTYAILDTNIHLKDRNQNMTFQICNPHTYSLIQPTT